MRSGRCPKCGSKDVHHRTPDFWSYAGRLKQASVSISTFSMDAILSCYVCVSCGYTEMYIEDRRKLDAIARKWPLMGHDDLK